MAININDFTEVPFQELPPQSVAIKNCTVLRQEPAAVPVTINWSNYAAPGLNPVSIRIPLNINVSVRGSPIERFVAVYVDNSDNDFPVFIQFTDTGYGISVSANSIQWFPVVSNAFNVNFASSFVPNFVGMTRFLFSNVAIDPIEASQLMEVSPQWLRTSDQSTDIVTIIGNQTRAPSLGDRVLTDTFSLDTVGIVSSNILSNPDPLNPNVVSYIRYLAVDLVSKTLTVIQDVRLQLVVSGGSVGPTGLFADMSQSIKSNQRVRMYEVFGDISFVGSLHIRNAIAISAPDYSNLTPYVTVSYTIRER